MIELLRPDCTFSSFLTIIAHFSALYFTDRLRLSLQLTLLCLGFVENGVLYSSRLHWNDPKKSHVQLCAV